MTTVHHVSQCSSLRYSFSSSHKCPGLVNVSSRLQSDALCENAHPHADYSTAQIERLQRLPLRSLPWCWWEKSLCFIVAVLAAIFD